MYNDAKLFGYFLFACVDLCRLFGRIDIRENRRTGHQPPGWIGSGGSFCQGRLERIFALGVQFGRQKLYENGSRLF